MLLLFYTILIATGVFTTSTLAAVAANADPTITTNTDFSMATSVIVTDSALATVTFPVTWVPSTTWLTIPRLKPTTVAPPAPSTSYYFVVDLNGPWNLKPLPKCRPHEYINHCGRRRIYRLMRVLKDTLPDEIPPQRHIPLAGAVDRVAWVHDQLCNMVKKWSWEMKYLELRGLSEEGDEELELDDEEREREDGEDGENSGDDETGEDGAEQRETSMFM